MKSRYSRLAVAALTAATLALPPALAGRQLRILGHTDPRPRFPKGQTPSATFGQSLHMDGDIPGFAQCCHWSA